MRRRDLIALVGGLAVAWPSPMLAQQTDRVRRVAILWEVAEEPAFQSIVKAFMKWLEELGWIEDRNIQIAHRWGDGDPTRIQAYAAELVTLKPDVIVTASTLGVRALKRETRSIPIVFMQVPDPIHAGFVESLAHPGGNITGFINFERSLFGKLLEVLKEAAPHVTRVALVYTPGTAPLAEEVFVP